jgi:uncharacterized protein involved in propanediol utilization
MLWRVYAKKGTKSKQEHQTKSQLAAAMIEVVAGWFPERQFLVSIHAARYAMLLI